MEPWGTCTCGYAGGNPAFRSKGANHRTEGPGHRHSDRAWRTRRQVVSGMGAFQ
ncbi:Hypothetical protein SLIV_10562 [Streptomyces lividans TK24]|uniref:Uncharacterized protein n=1 Tax=Streptomyces lividans TK24 TaxID=457428 RepID=A0ABX6TQB8_STRLI|nr:Hypothetical protein SLIV_10562 [Streptomyces lividans TK24]QSJ08631.1 Hypothetical protein SLIVDG2_10562 [Streptomyces lividans]QTD69555.1 Hypothetical protein SLIVYQS_10562 [Streptomyces lividans TK24] [Streptomyces lividans]